MLHFPIFNVWFPANIMIQFKNFVPIVNFDLMSEIKPYTDFLEKISQANAIEKETKKRILEALSKETQNTGFPPDQIIALGYETFNPYLNLGSLCIVLFCYFGGVLINQLILWPLSKCG